MKKARLISAILVYVYFNLFFISCAYTYVADENQILSVIFIFISCAVHGAWLKRVTEICKHNLSRDLPDRPKKCAKYLAWCSLNDFHLCTSDIHHNTG